MEKKLEIAIRILGALHPDKDIEAWFQDEARLGLQPTVRRQWWLKGKRCIAPSDKKYQWLYAYAFVHPTDGRSSWFLLPTVNLAWMNKAIQLFGQEMDPHRKRMIVLVLDQAGFHSLPSLDLPENITVRFLPSHTPELQPAESAWPLLKEATHNRLWKNLDELEGKLIERCNYLMDHPDLMKGATGFSWACCTLKRNSIS